MLEPPRVYRSRLGRATQTGDLAAAAEAEMGLRANRIAATILKNTAGHPPLPPDVARLLRGLLGETDCGVAS